MILCTCWTNFHEYPYMYVPVRRQLTGNVHFWSHEKVDVIKMKCMCLYKSLTRPPYYSIHVSAHAVSALPSPLLLSLPKHLSFLSTLRYPTFLYPLILHSHIFLDLYFLILMPKVDGQFNCHQIIFLPFFYSQQKHLHSADCWNDPFLLIRLTCISLLLINLAHRWPN